MLNLDIDECLNNPCGANTDCTNVPGNFSCQCKTGFNETEKLICISKLTAFPMHVVNLVIDGHHIVNETTSWVAQDVTVVIFVPLNKEMTAMIVPNKSSGN